MEQTIAGLRVVVVGINYAPETTGIAPYTTDLCEHLAAAGAEVTAVAGLPHYPQWSVSQEYRGQRRAEETRNGVRVIRNAHFVPRTQGALRRGLYEGTFLMTSSRAVRGLTADLVIAVSPSLSGMTTGERIARRCGAPLGIIVQDLMGQAAGQSGIRGGGRVSAVVSRIERSGLNAADRVAVISDSFAEGVIATGVPADRVSVLRNHAHVQASDLDRHEARRRIGWDTDGFVVLHTGNMGHKQDLGNVIRTARLAQGANARLQFVFTGDGNQRHILEDLATGLDNVRFHDPIADDVYPVALRAADVLLVNERSTVVNMSLPSKLTSYFAAGRPVVAAVPPNGSTEREVARSGGGMTAPAGDPSTLLSTIQHLFDSPSRCDHLGAAGRRYATEHLSADAAHERLRAWVLTLMGADQPVVPTRQTEPGSVEIPARR